MRAVAITPLAGLPRAIEGVIDVRGEIAPVLDLRARFGRPAPPLSASEYMILVEAAGRLVVLRADGVDWVEDVPEGAVTEPGPLAAANETLAGIARLPDGVVLIEDPDRFLAPADFAALDAVLAEGARPAPEAS